MAMRPQWYAYSGIINRKLSETTEIISTTFEVYSLIEGRVLATFSSYGSAEDYITTNLGGNFGLNRIRENEVTVKSPAQQRGIALVPLEPLPIFNRKGTVLVTRGFWDVTSITSPLGNVSNFAFGLTFLPVAVVYDVESSVQFPQLLTYVLRDSPKVPDPLLDDVRWFCYDSFVRVTTDVNQDPPFYSKSKRKFSAGECLCAVFAVEVQVESLQSLSLRAGIRFRTLIQH